MKKLALLLVISLGLSVANAESVCNSYSINNIVPVGKHLSVFATNNYEQKKYWDELVMRYYTSEIKKSDKETLCIYMVTIGQGYLNTQLTPQDIEQFERFLVEKGDEFSYENYEKYRDSYLKALKFFKYYNKLDILYNKKKISIEHGRIMGVSDRTSYDDLGNIAMGLRYYENDAKLMVKKFVYGKNMGSIFGSDDEDLVSIELFKELNNKDTFLNNKDAKAIAKWAESKLKEAK